MSELHFLRPGYFLLFIPLFLILLALLRRKRGQGGWGKVCDSQLLPYILLGEAKSRAYPLTLLALVASLGIIALTGPTWERVLLPLMQEKSAMVIALDLSPAMNSEDLKPSRLQRALYKINDILKQRSEGQTALLVYTDEAFVVTPLTDDIRTIGNMLSSLDTTIMPTQGIDPEKAVQKSLELLKQGGISHGSILLVTCSSLPFADPGIPVSILGAGTEQGAPVPKVGGGFTLDNKGGVIISKLERNKLRQLSEVTGGRFSLLTADESDIRYLLRSANGSYQAEDSQGHWQWLDGGYWLVLFSLPFAAFLLRRGYLALALIVFSFDLQAGFWRTKDQTGQDLFGKELYAEASEEFQDPSWKAAAHYKAKNYQAAAELYNQDKTADGYYNLGNSLAMQGSVDEAIKAYEKALELQPDHEDAAHNKKVLEEQKQENEQQNQGEDKKENKKGDQDKKQDDQNPEDQNGKPEDQNGKPEDQEGKESQEPDKKDQEDYSKQMDKEMENQPQKSEEQKVAECDPQKEIDDRWLDRIPDDPGGLLRRKFLHQYKKGRS